MRTHKEQIEAAMGTKVKSGNRIPGTALDSDPYAEVEDTTANAFRVAFGATQDDAIAALYVSLVFVYPERFYHD